MKTTIRGLIAFFLILLTGCSDDKAGIDRCIECREWVRTDKAGSSSSALDGSREFYMCYPCWKQAWEEAESNSRP